MRVGHWKIQAEWGHLILATTLALVSLWYVFDAGQASDSRYNLILIGPCVAAVVGLYILTLLMDVEFRKIDGDAEGWDWRLDRLFESETIRSVMLFLLLLAYILVLEPLGFEVATFLFIGLCLLLQGERRVVRVIGFSGLYAAVVTWAVSFVSLAPIPTSFM